MNTLIVLALAIGAGVVGAVVVILIWAWEAAHSPIEEVWTRSRTEMTWDDE